MHILFKNPEFLYGLFFIIIPVIIHLFNFKRFKTVYFSDINFLTEQKNKTKSMSKLKHLLVLFIRILFIVFLVLVFAQPYITDKTDNSSNESNKVCIYIDNSFSTSNENNKGKILDIEKQKAISVANAFKNSKKYLLVTNDFNPKFSRFVSYNQFLDNVSSIEISSKTASLSEVLNYCYDIGNPSKEIIYIISDFQKNFIYSSKLKQYNNSRIYLLPTEVTSKNNLSVDSCYFSLPFHKYKSVEKLTAKISSYANKDYSNISAKLYINDSLRAISSFDINANSQKTIEFTYTNNEKGKYLCEIKIDDFPIVFDNSLYFSYNIKKNINILIINSNTDNYLESIYKTDNYFSTTIINDNNINVSEFDNYDLIILNNVNNLTTGLSAGIKKYLAKGKNVIFIPEVSTSYKEIYNKFLSYFNANNFSEIDSINTLITKINTNNNVFKNIFDEISKTTTLPKLKKFFKTNETNFNSTKILSNVNNEALLSEIPYKKGRLFIFSFNCTSNDEIQFIKSPIMFASFFNIALLSGQANKIYYNTSQKHIDINKTLQEPVYLTKSNNKNKWIPILQNFSEISRIYLNNVKIEAGHYLLSDNSNRINISFNYPRTESVMKFYDNDKLIKIIKDNNLKNWSIISKNNNYLTQNIIEKEKGVSLWYYFIILSIVMLIMEMIFLKFLK